MSSKYRWKAATSATMALALAVLVGGTLLASQAARASDIPDTYTAQRIIKGYEVTPVPVDLTGKDPLQVGMGSYIVNTVGLCNHCHSSAQYYKAVQPLTATTASGQGGNPYLLPPPNGPYAFSGERRFDGGAVFIVDPTTFVAGGQNFGAVYSKNLTPATNQGPSPYAPYSVPYAEGGLDWITYWAVLHNGVDVDQLFTQYDAATGTCPNTSAGTPPPNGCAKAPTNAALLQVMPWSQVRQLTDNDLNAVWQYLSAIPCTTNQANVNASLAASYGGGVLINVCPTQASLKMYRYSNGQVVPR